MSTIEPVFPRRLAVAALACLAVAGCSTGGHAPPEFGGNWKPLPSEEINAHAATPHAAVPSAQGVTQASVATQRNPRAGQE